MVLPILDFGILASRVRMRAHALVCVRAGVQACRRGRARMRRRGRAWVWARAMLLSLFKLSQWLRRKAVPRAFCLLAR